MEKSLFLNNIIESIDEMPKGNEKVKACIKRILKKIRNEGYIDPEKINLLQKAYHNGLDDLRAVAWYLNHKVNETVSLSVGHIKMEYLRRKEIVISKLANRRHRQFYRALSEYERALLVMRDKFGSWEDLEDAIRKGVVINPQLFTWLQRFKNGSGNSLDETVEKTCGLIDRIRQYERANKINLAKYKTSLR